MPYDAELADRIREVLERRRGITERKMFGGICFMANGHMCCGVAGDELMLRLGNKGAAQALEDRHARPMDFTGRPMRSMVFLDPAGVRSDGALKSWVDRALGFARSLPPR